MLAIIGVAIFLIAEYVFDVHAHAESTIWNVYYFGSSYLSIVFIMVYVFFRDNSKLVRIYSVNFGIVFLILFLIELWLLNLPFDDYIKRVNENKVMLFTFTLLPLILSLITTKIWLSLLRKK